MELLDNEVYTADDYVAESIHVDLLNLRDHNQLIMELKMEEAKMVVGAMETSLLLEKTLTGTSANGVKKAYTGITSTLKRIIDFVKNIAMRFIDKIQTVFGNNEEWLKNREKDFNSMNYAGLQIEMVPYWVGYTKNVGFDSAFNKLIRDINRVSNANDTEMNDLGKYKDVDEFNKAYMSAFYDADVDIRDGILNYLRVGNRRGADTVTLEGNELKSKVTGIFIPFLKSYSKVVAECKERQRKLEGSLNLIIKETNTRSLNESFLYETTWNNTPLGTIVIEADVVDAEKNSGTVNPSNSKATQNRVNTDENIKSDPNNPNAKDSANKGNTSVKVNSNGMTQQQRDASENLSNLSNLKISILNSFAKSMQLMMACSLTVAEERSVAYMNAVKAVYNAANTRHGRKGNKTPKEETK